PPRVGGRQSHTPVASRAGDCGDADRCHRRRDRHHRIQLPGARVENVARPALNPSALSSFLQRTLCVAGRGTATPGGPSPDKDQPNGGGYTAAIADASLKGRVQDCEREVVVETLASIARATWRFAEQADTREKAGDRATIRSAASGGRHESQRR